jgi:hypothetical protein
MTIDNCPGAWGSGSPDPMYHDYIYPFSGNGTITLTSLPAGKYDLYAYSADGNYEITVGALSYGIKTTRDQPLMTPLVWTEGVQYARFANVEIGAGQDMVLTVRPGLDGTAMISGLQLVAVPEPSGTALMLCGTALLAFWRPRRQAGA